MPQRFELGVIGRSQDDRHETKITRQILKKRKLHLEGVLGLVRHRVLAKLGIGNSELACEFRIDLRAAQRRLPSSVGNNSLRLAAREMSRPEQKKTPRQFHARINSSSNVAGIAIARVGN